MKPIACVTVDTRHTTAMLVDLMQVMKAARDDRAAAHVVVSISGYGDDPRDLWEVPEVRALCRRLVAAGFAAYLDPATSVPGTPEVLRGAFGALEVWLIGEGLYGSGPVRLVPATIERFDRAMAAATVAAARAVGPATMPN